MGRGGGGAVADDDDDKLYLTTLTLSAEAGFHNGRVFGPLCSARNV